MSALSPHQTTVPAASAGRETYWVLALIALIIMIAGLVIVARQTSSSDHALAVYELDLRSDLSSAEQGLYSDLNVVADELLALLDDGESLPSPNKLAKQGFPPFIADATARNRGAHSWQLQHYAEGDAYIGTSQDRNIARSFLLRIQVKESSKNMDIWLHGANTRETNNLSTQRLIDTGWKQVSSHFNVGATRNHFHD